MYNISVIFVNILLFSPCWVCILGSVPPKSALHTLHSYWILQFEECGVQTSLEQAPWSLGFLGLGRGGCSLISWFSADATRTADQLATAEQQLLFTRPSLCLRRRSCLTARSAAVDVNETLETATLCMICIRCWDNTNVLQEGRCFFRQDLRRASGLLLFTGGNPFLFWSNINQINLRNLQGVL